ncbi:C6 zinc finger domain-containing protein [Poronia punctata]|nr:C6 zinc finger domain-containing protein [Poronia punctata]
MAEPTDAPAKPATGPSRKKFATPPVKIACLSCRASRTRCNGDHPCSSCITKDRECVYKPSRRGGPRIRKKSRPSPEFQEVVASLPPASEELPQAELPVEAYIGPGAGLKTLADEWQNSDALYYHILQPPVGTLSFGAHVPVARAYGHDDNAILNAYYIWIHPYFPILPPPEDVSRRDEPVSLAESQRESIQEPSSPIALAISAILALIPCPDDTNASGEASVRWRRTYSQFLAKAALEGIESESDRPESSFDPSKALDDSDDEMYREKFHSQVPLELEAIIALDLLSVYEYAQRGNLKKMRARAGAALVAAMSLYLHKHSDEEDEYTEARRRTWWMTYICVCQGSIVGNTLPTLELFGSSYTARFPTIQADREAFPAFVRAQQSILSATMFVIEFNNAKKAGKDMTPVYRRMQELERLLAPLVNQSDTWPSNYSLTQPVDRSEAVVANSLRCISRIKLNSARIKVHRYCAFFDVAVFSSKHCDLTSLPKGSGGNSEPQQLQACCVTTLNSPQSLYSYSTGTVSPVTFDSPSPNSNAQQQFSAAELPFASHDSSAICLKSAFTIAESFDAMPYPNPSGQEYDVTSPYGPRTTFITPRTMPSFACCAMQCSYALLMVKSRTEYPSAKTGDQDEVMQALRGRLQQGLLSVLATLENYATAFEALGGMRDQIRDKVDLSINAPSIGSGDIYL